MEATPLFPPSPEEDDDDEADDDDDSSTKRRRSLLELLSDKPDEKEAEDAKTKAVLEIAQSLFQSPSEEGEKSDEEPEDKDEPEDKAESTDEQPNETTVPDETAETDELTAVLSPEEEVYVNQTIAANHLEEPITPEPPEPAVNDFLEKVVAGAKPDEAYVATVGDDSAEETIDDLQSPAEQRKPDSPPEVKIEQPQSVKRSPFVETHQPSKDQAAKPPVINDTVIVPPKRSTEAIPTAEPVARTEQTRDTKPETKSKKDVTTELAGYIIGRRAGKKRRKTENAPKTSQIKQQVKRLEQKLTTQELTIQRLAQDNKTNQSQNRTEAKSAAVDIYSQENLIVQELADKTAPLKPSITAERVLDTLNPVDVKSAPADRLNDTIQITASQLKSSENSVYEHDDSPDLIKSPKDQTNLRYRQIQPEARVQLPPERSRINLGKPERMEHIGKVIVAAEAPLSTAKLSVRERVIRPNNIRQYFRPEEVKTMRREDLLIVSEKIIVEGASLKDMYENSLFSERALRRLVSEYLKGNDIREQLRREIIEKEIDFERDPMLRDKNRNVAPIQQHKLFDRILETVNTGSKPGSRDTVAGLSNKGKADGPDKKPKQQTARKSTDFSQPSSSHLFAGFMLSLLIILLTGLIIYLLMHRY